MVPFHRLSTTRMVKTALSLLSAETLILARASFTDFDTMEAFWTNNLMGMVTLGLMMKSGANFGTASFGMGILGEVRISDWKDTTQATLW